MLVKRVTNYPGKEALQGMYILNQKRKMNLNETKNTVNYNLYKILLKYQNLRYKMNSMNCSLFCCFPLNY